MSMPKAYQPEQGFMYQLLVKFPYDKAYEHCDYAKDVADKNFLLNEYRDAYASWNCTFKAIMLPRKYWEAKA